MRPYTAGVSSGTAASFSPWICFVVAGIAPSCAQRPPADALLPEIRAKPRSRAGCLSPVILQR